MDPISSLRLATVSVEFNLTALYFVALVVAGMIGLIVRHKLRQYQGVIVSYNLALVPDRCGIPPLARLAIALRYQRTDLVRKMNEH